MSACQIKQARNILAKRNLIDFTTTTKPNFVTGWFNKVIAKELQQFYFDVMAGKQPRLMIFAPPRSGKSELFSRRFPAWALGQNPDLQIITSSYSAELASRMNRDVQRIIEDKSYSGIFPKTVIPTRGDGSGKLRNADMFELVGADGAYRSAGVDGGITGMGADIAIIDDPIKNAVEANSFTIREGVWDWYTSTLYTRLSPKSGILLGMTRWHEDDLAGRLLKEMEKGGDQWRIVCFPAIAEQDEEYRKIGEALQPERFDLDFLNGIKKAVGSHYWNAMYQQHPTTKGGGIIKGAWFGRYKIPPKIRYKAIYADTALKTKQHNDYSVFIVAGKGDDGKMYVIDLVRGKWEAHELEMTLTDLWNKHNADKSTGTLTKVIVEDKASGTPLIQNIRRKATFPIIGQNVSVDKYSRVLGVQGYIESGYIMLPDNAPWVRDFLSECESFTANDAHAHDDQVDSLVMAINDILAGGAKSMFSIL